MAKRGRKKIENPVDKRTSKILVSLTEAEKDEITKRAGQIPIARYCREYLLTCKAMKVPPVIPEANLRIYSESASQVDMLSTLSEELKEYERCAKEGQMAIEAIRDNIEKLRIIMDDYRLSLLKLGELKTTSAETVRNTEETLSERSDDSKS